MKCTHDITPSTQQTLHTVDLSLSTSL